MQQVPGALSPGAKQQGRETEHSFPSTVETKNEYSYTFPTLFVLAARCLTKNNKFAWTAGNVVEMWTEYLTNTSLEWVYECRRDRSHTSSDLQN
jgi:hypothetical protein